MDLPGGDSIEQKSQSCSGARVVDCPIDGIEGQRRGVLNKLRDSNIRVVTEGLIILGNRTVKVNSVLHDTGASDHNYISPTLVVIAANAIVGTDTENIGRGCYSRRWRDKNSD